VSEQGQEQTQVPAVVGDLLDNLRAVVADQIQDEDAWLLADEMVNQVRGKFLQVFEDGKLMVEAALEERDEALSLKQFAEQKAKEIIYALDDWMVTDQPEVKAMIDDIQQTISEELSEGWESMVAGEEFVEKCCAALMFLTGGQSEDAYDIGWLFLHIVDNQELDGLEVTDQMLEMVEALYGRLKEIKEAGPQQSNDEIEGDDDDSDDE
jgi:hypothetical protein